MGVALSAPHGSRGERQQLEVSTGFREVVLLEMKGMRAMFVLKGMMKYRE